jgi:hypothetical protein
LQGGKGALGALPTATVACGGHEEFIIAHSRDPLVLPNLRIN